MSELGGWISEIKGDRGLNYDVYILGKSDDYLHLSGGYMDEDKEAIRTKNPESNQHEVELDSLEELRID